MANYKETEVIGSAWTRSFHVEVNNPVNQIPSIAFREEDVFMVNGEVIHRQKQMSPTNSILEFLADPSTTFDLLNPETNEVIGSAQYHNIYVILYSLYQKLAVERDVREAARLEVVQPTPLPTYTSAEPTATVVEPTPEPVTESTPVA